jgi:hypothetical protein
MDRWLGFYIFGFYEKNKCRFRSGLGWNLKEIARKF